MYVQTGNVRNTVLKQVWVTAIRGAVFLLGYELRAPLNKNEVTELMEESLTDPLTNEPLKDCRRSRVL